MKKYILILGLFLLTGCNCNYDVEFNNKTINEKVKIDIQNDELYFYTENTSMDDNVFLIMEDGINPLVNSENIVYDRNIEDTNYGKRITLEKAFNSDEFKKYSFFINDCFENVNFDYENGNYKIKLTGYFYCFYDDEITINIKSNNTIKANGQKNNDNYTWIIDSNNYNNVDIEVEISTKDNIRYYIYIGIAIVAGFGIILFLMYVIGNIMGRNNVNKI